MNKLQNIKIPHKNLSDVPVELYLRTESEQIRFKDGKLFPTSAHSQLTFEFSTFFGAFSLPTWCGHAGLDQIGVTLEMNGTGTVTIWHETDKAETIKLRDIPFDTTKEQVSVLLDNLRGKTGILYPKIETNDPDFVFHGGHYWTPTPPRHDARLTIIMPTFKRERYVKKNLDLLFEEILSIQESSINLLIIDNGQTLGSEILPEGVRIIPNKNFGGSGGFARGVIEALDDRSTHVLFCDDDIQIEPESIIRLQALLGYIDEKTVVGGGMMFFSKMTHLCEIGARYESLTFRLCHKNLDLTRKDSLAKYDLPKDMNYFGWWFFACSKKVFKDEGLPFPFFVRSDDIEFGLRLVEKGYTMASLLGLGVWHEEFNRKVSPVMEYYVYRNGLITMWVHEKGLAGFEIVRMFYKRIFQRLTTYRYQTAHYILLGLEDALKGPDFLENLSPPTHHTKMMGEQTELMVPIEPSELIRGKFKKTPLSLFARRIQKAIGFITMNGHLLPSAFMIKGEEMSDPGFLVEDLRAIRRDVLLRHPAVLYYDPIIDQGIMCRIDRKKFFYLLFLSLKLGIRVLLTNSRMVQKWKSAHERFTSVQFWRTYLGINQ